MIYILPYQYHTMGKRPVMIEVDTDKHRKYKAILYMQGSNVSCDMRAHIDDVIARYEGTLPVDKTE